MMKDLIKLDDLLREFWESLFEGFPFRGLLILLIGAAIFAIILLLI